MPKVSYAALAEMAETPVKQQTPLQRKISGQLSRLKNDLKYCQVELETDRETLAELPGNIAENEAIEQYLLQEIERLKGIAP